MIFHARERIGLGEESNPPRQSGQHRERAGMSRAPAMDLGVILPIKRLNQAKSRLRPGLGSIVPLVARAMACDVLDALVDARSVDTALVVSDDPIVAFDAGARGLPVWRGAAPGLNAAVA